MTAAARITRMIRSFGVVFAVAAMGIVAWASPWAGAAEPSLVMTPGPTGHPYADGQTLSLSVGPNSRFTPNTRVEVLECAAPNGGAPGRRLHL